MIDINYIMDGKKKETEQKNKNKLDKLADERMMMGAREEHEKDKIKKKYKDKKTIQSKIANVENKYKKKQSANLRKANQLRGQLRGY